MKAMIFAAGLGSRLKPLTNSKPKALVEINGKTLLEIVILRLKSHGFKDIIINIHHFAEQIINFIENHDFGVNIKISDERNLLLNTGGGLKNTSSFFQNGKPFLVHNVDIISDIDLTKFYKTHLKSKSFVTLAVRNRHTSRYLLFDKNAELCGWKNLTTGEEKIIKIKTKLTPLAFSGIQVIDPRIFSLMPTQEVFSIIDLYLDICSKYKISGYDHSKSNWLDVGKPNSLIVAKTLQISGNYLSGIRL